MIACVRGSGWWVAALLLAACGDDAVGGTDSAGSSGGTGTSTTGEATTNSPTTGDDTTTTMGATGGGTTTTTDPTTGEPVVSTGGTTTSGDDTTTGDGTTTADDTTSGTTAPASICGDDTIDLDEDCDGDNLGGATCSALGFDGGTLACQGCAFDTTACAQCGNGVVEADEACDDANQVSGDGCDADCQIEACDPDGVYAVQGPAIAYTCCLGLVTVNITGFTLSNDGATIASSPSNPAPLQGGPTTCPDGDFANMAAIQGGCTEGYSLTGDITDNDTWTGTYKLTFTGDQCSCFNGQLGTPCIDQSFPVTAKR